MSRGPGSTQREIVAVLAASGGRINLARLQQHFASQRMRPYNLRRAVRRLEAREKVIFVDDADPSRCIISLPPPVGRVPESKISHMLSELSKP